MASSESANESSQRRQATGHASPARHRGQPAGAGYGSSRFSSPSRHFKVLYAGEDFSTAFAEAVVRDRFEGKQHRFLFRPYLDALCVTAISSNRELALVDLTGAGP